MMGRKCHMMLGAAMTLAMICSACGSGSAKPQASASTQGFVPAPAPNTTDTTVATSVPTAAASATLAPTAAASVTTPASPTPTPFGTPDVQASAQANGCNVTQFASSGPPQVQAQVYPKWYGQGDFWFAPPSIYAEFGMERLATATVWFQGVTPAVVLSKGNPTITGHLQGDATTTLTTSPGSSSMVGAVRPQEPVHGVNVSLPKPGCWQLTVTSGSESLNVTLWAVSITQRPDVATRVALRAELTPYSPPSSCQVTNWNGPSDHGAPFLADYSIAGQGITVDSALPLYFVTQPGYLDVYHAFPDPPSLSGQLVGDAQGVVRSSWIQHATESSPNGWRGQLTFSNPGCWKLQVIDGSAKVAFTVYVYPADCYHAQNTPKPASCKPPA